MVIGWDSLGNLSQYINDSEINEAIKAYYFKNNPVNDKKAVIDFYKNIGITEVFVDNAIRLMQSIELSYARYCFYKSMGIEINKNNYKKLFLDQKKFISIYGITNKELIQMYNYDEYINKVESIKNI